MERWYFYLFDVHSVDDHNQKFHFAFVLFLILTEKARGGMDGRGTGGCVLPEPRTLILVPKSSLNFLPLRHR